MDFELSAEQKQLRDTVTRFARRELNGDVGTRDREARFPLDLWRKAGELKLQGLPVPEEHGGAGLDPLSMAIALDALGHGCEDGGLVFALGAHLLAGVVPIWQFGTQAQRSRYLPDLCAGRRIVTGAMTEPDSGSDAFALRTRAVADGDGFVLDGAKTFATNAPVADLALVFAVTDPGRGFHGGVSAFLVDLPAHGVRVGKPIETMGLRTSGLSEIALEGVRVPRSALLGEPGSGALLFGTAMNWERVGLSAALVGTLQRLIEASVRHSRTRRQSGQPIGKFQAVSHRVADMKVALDAARLLVYRAAASLEKGAVATVDAAVAKLFASESLVEVALAALQVHGGYGFTTEQGVERALRDAVASRIYSGTSEVQRNLIAGWLGL